MNAWSNLPNAKHIDWVLDSLKSNIDIWSQTGIQASDQAWNQASDQARDQVWNQARDQVWNQAWDQAWDQALDQVSDQAWNQAWKQAYGVLLALITYDDCDQYLSMTFDELKTWMLISEKPQAILLLPIKWVLTKI